MQARASPWQQAHARLRALERDWAVPGAPEPVARQFLRRILWGPLDGVALRRELGQFGLMVPPLADAALALRADLSALADLPDGRHPDRPCVDVYHAALVSVGRGFWETAPDLDQVYRGQRDARWPVLPSLFRGDRPPDPALDHLTATVRGLRRLRRDLSDEQAVALAQHHGRELGVRTWLIDVTWEPRVALFFASDGGRDGDVGVVTCIVRKEWERLSAGGRNRLGRIHLIEVPDVLRIGRQRALFLDTSHPDLFEQYVPHSVWFGQHDGRCFEDPLAEPPVTRAFLYPADDPLHAALAGLERLAGGPPLAVAPAADASAPLGADDYQAIARSWCEELGVALDAYRGGTLRIACRFHAELQRHRDRVDIPERSLLRLHDAVRLLCEAQQQGGYPTAAEALRWTFSRVPPPDAEWLRGLLQDIERGGP